MPSEHDTVDTSEEQVLLDENLRKSQGGHSFYSMGGLAMSPDHQLMAWSEDTQGNEHYTLRVMDLRTGQLGICGISLQYRVEIRFGLVGSPG